MFKNLLTILKKGILFISSPFSKLRIFYQILVIILIMLGCVVIEGYSNLGVIDQMQQNSSQVMAEGIQILDALFNLNNDVLELKSNYLEKLNNAEELFQSYSGDNLRYNISNIKNYDPNAAGELETLVTEIEKVLKEPISSENYGKLKDNFLYISIIIKNLDSQIKFDTTQRIFVGNKFSQDSKGKTITMILISFFISLILALLIVNSISRPLKSVVKATNLLATGDLSFNVEAKGCYEVTTMVRGFNRALTGLRQLIKGINQESDYIIAASKDLKDASLESGRSASEVARAMEELAAGTTEQTNQISQAVSTVTELSELVRKVSTDTANIAASSENMSDSAVIGQNVTNDIANEINELYQSTNEVAEVIKALSSASDEISNITSVISGIAEQTSLLALNAAIEAARAGSQGKGFSVVAKETGKLAEQSKQSALMIADLIKDMGLKTKHAVEVIEKGMERVAAGKSLAGEATVTFSDIFRDLRSVLAEINTVAASARLMSEKNEQVISTITTISAISEESMASTEEVSATAQEQSAAAEEVSSLAENLEGIANKLKASVASFNVGGEGAKSI